MRKIVFLLALAAVVAARAALPEDTRLPEPEIVQWSSARVFRFQRGDDPRWSAAEFDDREWQEISARDFPSRAGIYWVRWRFHQPPEPGRRPRDGLMLKVVASYDIFWDGRLIGRNGRPGATPEQEIPGDVDALFQIPPELLTPGEHVVAVRMSSQHTGFPSPTYSLNFVWGNFRAMLVFRSRTAIWSVMAVGAALVVAIVFGLMWWLAGRRRSLLIFSALFLCIAVMQALQAWRWFYEYPYHWHFARLLAITGLTTAIAVLLPGFVMSQFKVGRPRTVLGLLSVWLAIAWAASHVYNLVSLLACTCGFAFALALSVRAVWLGRRGARVACGGLALSMVALIVAPRDFLEYSFFLSAGPAALGLLVALALQLRDERREAQQAVLAAARLEVELLKKNIQPHFLLNTLATIMEVIEREPKTAVAMIEALADEFRLLAGMSGEKLIPLAQEIELCRAHLAVMSLRKGARCALTIRGADGGEAVPPALFHTLIENGLTHLLPSGGRIDFALEVAHRPTSTRYSLVARGERQGAPAGTREGTGLRYIKARLEESFTGRWSVVGRAAPEGWETVIEIGNNPSAPRADLAARAGAAAVPGRLEHPA